MKKLLNAKLVWDGGDEIQIPEEMGKPRADQLQGTVRERLVELAGRICYDSCGTGRDSANYHKHIQEVGHLSVLEHAYATIQFNEKISPSVFLNRPDVWVEYLSPSCVRVTLNPRSVLEWDSWVPDVPIANGSVLEAQAVGDYLAYRFSKLCPQIVSHPASSYSWQMYEKYSLVVPPESENEKWVSMFMGGSRGFCYDSETEVLTSEGWKKWTKVRGDEKFASLNLTSGFMEFQCATAVVREPYHGKMYKISSQCIDLLVTPNHRMVVKLHDTQAFKRGEENFRVLTAKELDGRRVHYKRTARWKGESPEFFDIPPISVEAEIVNQSGSCGTRTIVCNGRRVRALAFARFVGYWLAEGSLDHQKGSGYSVILSQKCGGKAWIGMHECISDLGFTFNERELNGDGCMRIRINGGRSLYDYLKPYSLAENKGIPDDIKNWGPEYQEALINAYLEGDGSQGKGRHAGEGHTVSRRLADDLQEAALKAGFSATVRVIDRRSEPPRKGKWAAIKSKRLIYIVGFSKLRGQEPLVNHGGKKHDEWTHYSGMVYCVTVPNGTLYVRRNGKPCWSGNSHELVRHGNFTAISQRSTRFVSEDESDWVDHPLVLKYNEALIQEKGVGDFVDSIENVKKVARSVYSDTVKRLQEWLTKSGADKLTARKQARGAARGYLGNALYTELIFSASVAQWKRMLRMRCSAPADAEIREVFAQALQALKGSRYAHCFEKFELQPSPDGLGQIAVEK